MAKKYRLSNLDCASCAEKIENSLKGLEGVSFVSVNFATATLNIETDNIESVKKEIMRIEPQVKVFEVDEDTDTHHHGEEEQNIKGELIAIVASAVFFVLGIIFNEALHNTAYSFGEYLVFLSAYFLCGWGVLYNAGRNILQGKVFDENFLMSVATLGAVFIHQLPEAVGVMLFYKTGEFFQDLSITRSRKSIKALLEIRPDYANIKVNGEIKKVSPAEVNIGDVFIVRPGEKVPLDGEVIAGSSQVDTSALTGESVPRKVETGEKILAGMINKTGVLEVKVTKLFGESSIAKILDMVENATSQKAETEKFITKFARYYTPVVVFGALAVALLPPLLTGGDFKEWLYRALILLVISCPCALVISIPLGYFGGIGAASRRGILIKGSNYLDAFTAVKTVVFDKTGTLTKGVFKVSKIVPQNDFDEKDIIKYAAMAESHSNHPIAQSIMEAYGQDIDASMISDYKEIAGHGIKVTVDSKLILAGNDRLMHKENIKHDVCMVEGTVVHLAVDKVYAGYIIISDEIKEDALKAVRDLRTLGVKKVVMLTGDNKSAAESVAKKLELDSFIPELLPEGKVSAIEELLGSAGKYEKLAFVGDGINDAPVIARADVGIAMGEFGSDAAIETADVVIMTDAPSKVAEAIRIGRKTRKIVLQNISLALLIKGVFLVLGAVGVATIWEAVFADVGVTLMAIFNATRVSR